MPKKISFSSHVAKYKLHLRKEKRKESNKKWRDKNKDYMKVYREQNKDRILEIKKKHYHKVKDNTGFKEAAKDRWYKRNYGIGLEEYNKLFKDQNGECAICGAHQKDLLKSLAVDHDHATGRVRALLCSRCNMMIGLVEESTQILYKSIQYLDKYRT